MNDDCVKCNGNGSYFDFTEKKLKPCKVCEPPRVLTLGEKLLRQKRKRKEIHRTLNQAKRLIDEYFEMDS